VAPLVGVFTGFFFLTLFRIRRAVASNLEPVLGPAGFLERQRRIFRSLHAFAWCLTERFERLATERPFDVAVENFEHWHTALSEGSGCVMLTAHLGLYEVGSMMPASVEARHVHLVREPEVDPRVQAYIREAVAAVQGPHYTMHFQDGDLRVAMALLEALQRGELVAIQGDRPRAGGRTVQTELFGRPFAVPAGPAALARMAGSPLLPVFAIREGRRRFRVVFCPPIRVAHGPNREADVAEAASRFAADIEAAIRRAPHQWFVFRELWPARPSNTL
jgi:KDO2-lipid IV(A) lauroyltransferase